MCFLFDFTLLSAAYRYFIIIEKDYIMAKSDTKSSSQTTIETSKLKEPTKILTSKDAQAVGAELNEETGEIVYKRTTNSILPEEIAESNEKNIKKVKTYTEDNLELKQMSAKERRQAKKLRMQENMEGMSTKQKIGYIIYYYKWRAIMAALIAFLVVAVPLTIYKNSRPVAISYALLNTYADIEKESFQDYKDMFGYSKSDQIIQSNFIGLDPDTYEEDYAKNTNSPNFTQLPMLCYRGYFDIVIGDAKALEYCSSQSLIQPLDQALLPDVYQAMINNHNDKIIETKNYNGQVLPYAIDISDTEFAKSLNLDYDHIYIGFTSIESRNFKNSKQFLTYLFDIKY